MRRQYIVHADRAYDTNRISDIIEDRSAVPDIHLAVAILAWL